MASKLRVILALLATAVMGSVMPAWAGPRDDVMQGAVRCAGIADDRTWLDCYYGAAQPMRGRLGLPPASASQQNLVPPARPGGPAPAVAVAPAAAQRPGFFERIIDNTAPHEQKPEPPTHMTSYRFDSAGYFTVTLANGETWRQSGGETTLAHWHGKPETYSVVIQPGQVGLATMKVGRYEAYEVERLKP